MPITTPLTGASVKQIWNRDARSINATGDGDKYAPFTLGTRGLTNDSNSTPLAMTTAQFVRVSATIPNANGTTAVGVTNGVTASAGTGNNWYNLSGATPIQGDYMFLTSALPATT